MTHGEPSWRGTFLETVKKDSHREFLCEAAATERLKPWTKALTAAMVDMCQTMGWDVAARAHRCTTQPIDASEYLNLDVMALPLPTDPAKPAWRFPIAIFELENQLSEERIAYSMWKLLNVRARHRAVFCYRPEADQAGALASAIKKSVIDVLSVKERLALDGDQWLVVGNRGANEVFPYGYFKWFLLDKNSGQFQVRGG